MIAPSLWRPAPQSQVPAGGPAIARVQPSVPAPTPAPASIPTRTSPPASPTPASTTPQSQVLAPASATIQAQVQTAAVPTSAPTSIPVPAPESAPASAPIQAQAQTAAVPTSAPLLVPASAPVQAQIPSPVSSIHSSASATSLHSNGAIPLEILPPPPRAPSRRRRAIKDLFQALYRKLKLPERLRSPLFDLFFAAAATAFFAFSVFYAASTTSLAQYRSINTSGPLTILILTLVSNFVGIFFTALIAGALDRMMWMLVARKGKGLSFASALSLMGGTPFFGIFLYVLIPHLGTILTVDVSTPTLYIPRSTFPVSAGIGLFNASYVTIWAETMPLIMISDFRLLLNDPTVAFAVDPIIPSEAACSSIPAQANSPYCSGSYFLSQGMKNICPWPNLNMDSPASIVYQVSNMIGYQLDFRQVTAGEIIYGDRDCTVYGADQAALLLCIAESVDATTNITTLLFKYAACPLGLSTSGNCLSDKSWFSSSGFSVALKVYQRRATVTLNRYTTSIIGADDLSAPLTIDIPASSLRYVFDQILGGQASGLRFPAYNFITVLQSKIQFGTAGNAAFYDAAVALRNLAAMPVYYFNDLNLGGQGPQPPSPNATQPGLAPEFTTTASLADPVFTIAVARSSLYAYAVIGTVLLGACWLVYTAALWQACRGKLPKASAWAGINVMALGTTVAGSDSAQGLAELLLECGGLTDAEIVEKVRGRRLYQRRLPKPLASASAAPAP
ncbi:MAG: hypothetical protein M1829_000241 [Trizodia sp. TS-e1964]|nr:MAG: hypothetical protein M1829_000241 [Trizodia sp. TS-e1964]